MRKREVWIMRKGGVWMMQRGRVCLNNGARNTRKGGVSLCQPVEGWGLPDLLLVIDHEEGRVDVEALILRGGGVIGLKLHPKLHKRRPAHHGGRSGLVAA